MVDQDKPEEKFEVRPSRRRQITSYTIVDGETHDGFPIKIWHLDYEETLPVNGSTSPDDSPVDNRAEVKAYSYESVGTLNGAYEMHTFNGDVLKGRYGRFGLFAGTGLPPELMSKLAESNLPLKVKVAMGLEAVVKA